MIFVGLIIGADTLEITPKRHYAAFLFGLVPLVTQWGDTTVSSSISSAYDEAYGSYFSSIDATYHIAEKLNLTLQTISWDDIVNKHLAGFNYIGTRNLGLGGLLESIFLTAIMIFLIDRRFLKAGAWSVVAALLSFIGLINSPKIGWLVQQDDVGWKFSVAYLSCAALFFLLHFLQLKGNRQLVQIQRLECMDILLLCCMHERVRVFV